MRLVSLLHSFCRESARSVPLIIMPRILLLLLFCIPVFLFGQSRDEELAAQYYFNGEFDKAAVIYEKLWSKSPESTYLYRNYLNTLVALKKYKEAASVIKAQQKKFPREMGFLVDELWLMQQAGEGEKAKSASVELAKRVRDEDDALGLALALIQNKFYLAAETAFLKGRAESGDTYLFSGDLAGLYATMGRKDDMVREGLNHLQSNPNYLSAVQNLFQDNLQGEDWNILIKQLRQRLQKSPEDPVGNELLMWALVQKRDFDSAFIQFRAIDKRNNLGGRRMMELAGIALANGDFDNAVKSYDYVVSLGQRGPFYFQAKYGLLEVRYNRIVVYNRYNHQDLLDAEREFTAFIQDFGAYFETEFAERKLAHLYIFYLDKPDTAIQILQHVAGNPRVKPAFRGEVKLELGDAYLMMGEVWDAELTYSQVDKDFKEDILGQEAKFRMARLFYFKGEFERANAYLEVLKTATTQLISNNAIDLSLLILDNTGLDTTEDAMRMYAKAELLIYRNKVQEGLKILNVIETSFPGHSLQDEILMAKAKAMIRMNLSDSALVFLEQLAKTYPEDILADNALFMMAQIYDKQKNDTTKAMEYYELILTKYPSSLFVVEARKRYRLLRGDKPDEQENNQIMFDRFMN
ncbi:MAG: tetratricopeptide repeat protein [Bacteroidetes bacterium]|nr:tetratricopeptide repeat protein [Bacteroidota bacterium]